MEVIQIDMPMPDNCVECRFNVSEFGYCNAMPVEFVGQVSDCEEDGKPEWCPLKAQEPIEARLHLCDSCTKLYPECDATADGIEFGCGFGNDNIIGCTAYENRWKANEPMKPTISVDAGGPCGNWWYQCGKCKEALHEGMGPDEVEAVEMVLWMWQKEQEARM